MVKFLFVLIIISLVSPLYVNAHIRGVPIMKINGTDTKVYPAQVSTSLLFDLPPDADIAPHPYLINQTLHFVIDPSQLPVGEDILKKTAITWDFGDGSKPQKVLGGLTNAHRYKKVGTFTMHVTADYGTAGYEDLGEQSMQATVLSIIPYKGYQTPKVSIQINNLPTSEKKEFSTDLNKSLVFTIAERKGSAANVLYQWDLGDGTTSEYKMISHRYRLPQYYVTPMIRVQDANGIYTDTFVTIRNSGKNDPNDPEREAFLWNLAKGIGMIMILFLVIIIWKRQQK